MSGRSTFVSTSTHGLALAEDIAGAWTSLDVRGHFLARNIDTGAQLGFDVTQPIPLASVVKVPLALAVLERTADGRLDPACPITIDPATRSHGATGVAAYRFPATLAVADLLYQALAVSDNACADALLDLIGVDALRQALCDWGCHDIIIRHRIERLYDCAVGAAGTDFGLALELAIDDDREDRPEGGPHRIAYLDAALGNVATANALVDLLQQVWLDQVSDPRATEELRRLMAMQVFHQRLSSDLRTDTVRISAKTGTFLHLRHEIGVVEAESGGRVAIAALTRTTRRAVVAQDIDLAIGDAARSAFELLR